MIDTMREEHQLKITVLKATGKIITNNFISSVDGKTQVDDNFL